MKTKITRKTESTFKSLLRRILDLISQKRNLHLCSEKNGMRWPSTACPWRDALSMESVSCSHGVYWDCGILLSVKLLGLWKQQTKFKNNGCMWVSVVCLAKSTRNSSSHVNFNYTCTFRVFWGLISRSSAMPPKTFGFLLINSVCTLQADINPCLTHTIWWRHSLSETLHMMTSVSNTL